MHLDSKSKKQTKIIRDQRTTKRPRTNPSRQMTWNSSDLDLMMSQLKQEEIVSNKRNDLLSCLNQWVKASDSAKFSLASQSPAENLKRSRTSEWWTRSSSPHQHSSFSHALSVCIGSSTRCLDCTSSMSTMITWSSNTQTFKSISLSLPRNGSTPLSWQSLYLPCSHLDHSCPASETSTL